MPMEMTTNMYTNGARSASRRNTGPRQFKIAVPVELDVESPEPILELQHTSLPILATGNDVHEVVRFLQNKPFGVTVIEAMNAEPRRVFDARKIAAYEFWGILERAGDRLRLSSLGQELADRIKPECEIHRRILRSIPEYLGALRSFFDQRLKIVTRVDAAAHWNAAHPDLDLSNQDEKGVEAIAVSFFSVCHAAELGTMTVGKRGQPARLRIDADELRDFFESIDTGGTSSLIPWPKPKLGISNGQDPTTSRPAAGGIYLAVMSNKAAASAIGQIQTVLELADFDDIVYQAATTDNFLPQSELAAIQQCTAAIFLLGTGDCLKNKNGGLELQSPKLAQISVAIAMLNNRVLILWNSRDGEPPEGLRQTNLHLFDGENFDWNTGALLIRRLKGFKA